jgi:hypothetical protein
VSWFGACKTSRQMGRGKGAQLRKKARNQNSLLVQQQHHRFTQCHLSGQQLTPPCVMDELGTLFNKDAVLQALLNKTLPPSLSYITGVSVCACLCMCAPLCMCSCLHPLASAVSISTGVHTIVVNTADPLLSGQG